MWMPSAWYSAAEVRVIMFERGLGHVGVRMAGGLELAVELAFDGGDVDDVLVALRGAHHERLEAGVEDEGGDGVDELGFEQFDGRDLGEHEAPGIALAQVDLLQVLVEAAFGKEMGLGGEFFGQERRPGRARRRG